MTITQPAFTRSLSTRETPGQRVKSFQSYNKENRTKSLTSFWCLCYFEQIYLIVLVFPIVSFEQLNVGLTAAVKQALQVE